MLGCGQQHAWERAKAEMSVKQMDGFQVMKGENSKFKGEVENSMSLECGFASPLLLCIPPAIWLHFSQVPPVKIYTGHRRCEIKFKALGRAYKVHFNHVSYYCRRAELQLVTPNGPPFHFNLLFLPLHHLPIHPVLHGSTLRVRE